MLVAPEGGCESMLEAGDKKLFLTIRGCCVKILARVKKTIT